MDPAAAPSPDHFGPYEVYERLGMGGMASVHRAKKRGPAGFERNVALKRMLTHLAEDPTFVDSFVREAKVASLLVHPNIAQIYDFGRTDGVYYIAMELVGGFDVRQLLRFSSRANEPIPLPVILSILGEAADALEFAHNFHDEQGAPMNIVHRDVSPSNLIVAHTGHLKVIDFGIAKASSRQLHTESGQVKGKLGYMAPEVALGMTVGPIADVFSLGVVAWELITASPLFSARTDFETMQRIRDGEILPPSQRNPACPPALDRLILAALDREPETRLASAHDFRAGIDQIIASLGAPSSARAVADWMQRFAQPDDRWARASGMQRSRTPSSRPSPAEATSVLRPRPPSGPPQLRRSAAEIKLAAEIWGTEPVANPEAALDFDAASLGLARSSGSSPRPSTAPPRTSGSSPQRSSGSGSAPSRSSGSDTAPPPAPPRSSGSGSAPRSSLAPLHLPLQAPAAHDEVPTERPRRTTGSVPPRPSMEHRSYEPPIAVVPPLLTPPAMTAPPPRTRSRSKRRSSKTPVLIALALATVASGLAAMLVWKSSTATTQVRVAFAIEPAGSIVQIDGRPGRATPFEAELAPGSYAIVARTEGHRAWVTTIAVRDGDAQTIRYTLEPALAKLSIDSDPRGLAVSLDGAPTGQVTPVTLDTTPGPHKVTVAGPGGEVWSEDIVATAAGTHSFSAAFAASIDPPEPTTPTRPTVTATAPRTPPQERTTPTPTTTTTTTTAKVRPKLEPDPVEPTKPEPAIEKPVVKPVVKPITAVEPTKPPPPPPPPPIDDQLVKPARTPVVAASAVTKLSGEIPTLHADEGGSGTVLAKVCIDEQGRVNTVKVIKTSASIAKELGAALKTWRYKPYLRDGLASPVCFPMSLRLLKR